MKENPQASPPKSIPDAENDTQSGSTGIKQFLNAFLAHPTERPEGTVPGSVVIVTLKDKIHKYFNIEDHNGITGYALQAMKTQNVYITMTLQDMALNKGIGPKGEDMKRSDVAAACMFGVWVDVDLHNEGNAHKADNLPTKEEWFALQAALEIRPSMIVDSGNGFHLYLLFNEPLYFRNDADREWAARLVEDFQLWIRNEMTKEGKKNGAEKGWKLDGTADLARILRVAGTFNHKTNPPKPVKMHALHPEVRYDAQALRAMLDLILKAQTESTDKDKSDSAKGGPKSKKEKTTKNKPQEAPTSDQPDCTADADLIADECAWVEHCVQDAAALSEPDWYQLASLLVRCFEGDQHFHDWSKPYQNYVCEEADEKLRHARLSPGPVTCEFIQREIGFDGCSDCVHCGHIKSPIVLGMGNVLRAIFPDCPVHLIIPGAYVINGNGIFTLKAQE